MGGVCVGGYTTSTLRYSLPKMETFCQGVNKTIIKYQLLYFLKEQYAKNITEVTNTKNAEGLSGADKLEMNLNKIDEGKCVMAELNAQFTINDIMRDLDIPISDDEIRYYRKHHHVSECQRQLVYSIYSSYFNSYRDLKLLEPDDYIRLLILLKKKLLLESGFAMDALGTDRIYLPYILTGNLEGKINTRLIRNNQYQMAVEESSIYDHLNNVTYRRIQEKDKNMLKRILSTFATTTFSYVSYENPELLGKPIEYESYDIASEILYFINNI